MAVDASKFPDRLEDVPVKLFKLVSGESIIAYVHKLDDAPPGLIGLEEPMTVIVESDHHFVMTPWLPFAESKLHVLEDFNVMLTTDVNLEIKAHYMRTILDSSRHGGISEQERDELRKMRGDQKLH
jgi:hypothetical protein